MTTSTPEGEPAPVADELQFEEAEYEAGAEPARSDVPVCLVCKQSIRDVYYEAGGQIVCGPCRGRIEEAPQAGSKLGRAFKALVFGSVAAAIGSAIYYAILRLTSINFGLVAVVVGVMVGGGVKAGSGNRGGLFYQLLAVFLTYSSIVAMYAVPGFIQAFGNRDTAQMEQEVDEEEDPADPPKAVIEPQKDAAKAKQAAPAGKPPMVEENKKEPRPNPLRNPLLLAFFVVFMLGFAYTFPVQVAISSPISGLIFGFALWEAWKINKRRRIEFNGPFRLAAAGGGPGAGVGGPGNGT
jgi:hypothetical protein